MQIAISARKIPLHASLKSFARLHLLQALQPFASHIARIAVELFDKNGRRGGSDKQCRISITLLQGARLRTHDIHADIRTATHRAIARTRTAVHRHLRSLLLKK